MCFVRSSQMLRATWFKDANAQLVFLGSGSVSVGKRVAKELEISEKGAKLLVDDSVGSIVYQKLGTKRGVLRTFTLRRWDNVVGLLRFPLEMIKGYAPTISILEFGSVKSASSAGDPFLQGATFVINENLDFVFRHVEESPGYPEVRERALRNAVENGERYGLVKVRKPSESSIFTRMKVGLSVACVLLLVWSIYRCRSWL